jgi:thiamine-monophosphate kinase
LTQHPLSSLGERTLIRRITARLAASLPAHPWVHLGPGDDAAVLEPDPGAYDVLTTDAVVEGVHFDRAFVPLDAVGHRALAVNLSDLAAMGASPRAALLSLVLPESLAVEEVDRMLDGLLPLAAAHNVAIAGGNVTRTRGPLVVDVTAIGSVRPRKVLTRGGARPGDEVYVTGSLGAAAVGLKMLRDRHATANLTSSGLEGDRGERVANSAIAGTTTRGNDAANCIERYLRPIPRVRAGVQLGRNRAATSCMDLSDGLADAVRQVAEASGVGMRIDGDALPIAGAVQAWHAAHGGDLLETVTAGGDDYELLFTVRPSLRGRLRGVRRRVGDLPITRIGTVTRGADVVLTGSTGVRELPPGFDHFR